TDVLFLVLLALVYLAKLFHRLYVSPHPKLPLETLGQLMWIRTGAFALLSVRRVKGVGFGFWPAPREWKIGAMYFGLLAPVAAVAGVFYGLSFRQAHSIRASMVTHALAVTAWRMFFG